MVTSCVRIYGGEGRSLDTLGSYDNEFLPILIGKILMTIDTQNQSCTYPRSVEIGVDEGRGPCACPGRDAILMPHIPLMNRLATRTGTRPTHPLHPSPCPYREPLARDPSLRSG